MLVSCTTLVVVEQEWQSCVQLHSFPASPAWETLQHLPSTLHTNLFCMQSAFAQLCVGGVLAVASVVPFEVVFAPIGLEAGIACLQACSGLAKPFSTALCGRHASFWLQLHLNVVQLCICISMASLCMHTRVKRQLPVQASRGWLCWTSMCTMVMVLKPV